MEFFYFNFVIKIWLILPDLLGFVSEGISFLFLQISTDLKNLIIKDCITEAVPYSRAELSKFDEVKAAAEDFQTFLIEKGDFFCWLLLDIKFSSWILQKFFVGPKYIYFEVFYFITWKL